MKKTLSAFATVLFLALAAMAHPPGDDREHRGKHGERMAEHLAAVLDLNEEQAAAARQLHAEMMAKAEPLMEQQRQQREELHALLESANPDPTEVGRKAIAAHAVGDQLEALHEDFKTRFSALLNEEQKAKLEELHEKHGKDHRSHGFGRGRRF